MGSVNTQITPELEEKITKLQKELSKDKRILNALLIFGGAAAGIAGYIAVTRFFGSKKFYPYATFISIFDNKTGEVVLGICQNKVSIDKLPVDKFDRHLQKFAGGIKYPDFEAAKKGASHLIAMIEQLEKEVIK